MTDPLFSEMQAVRWMPSESVARPVDGIVINRRWRDAHFDAKAGEWLDAYWLYQIQSGNERTQYDVWVFENQVQPR